MKPWRLVVLVGKRTKAVQIAWCCRTRGFDREVLSWSP